MLTRFFNKLRYKKQAEAEAVESDSIHAETPHADLPLTTSSQELEGKKEEESLSFSFNQPQEDSIVSTEPLSLQESPDDLVIAKQRQKFSLIEYSRLKTTQLFSKLGRKKSLQTEANAPQLDFLEEPHSPPPIPSFSHTEVLPSELTIKEPKGLRGKLKKKILLPFQYFNLKNSILSNRIVTLIPQPVINQLKKAFSSFQSSRASQKPSLSLWPLLAQALEFIRPTSKNRDLVILRPGRASGEWQLWKCTSKSETISKKNSEETLPSEPLLIEDHATPPPLSKKVQLIVGIPTRDLVIMPLWVSSEGDMSELVELELSNKNLLRRGMVEGLKTIPIDVKGDRSLLVALLPPNTISPATAPYLKHADCFEASARLIPQHTEDLFVWQELGEVCLGFLRKGHCVWFASSGESIVNASVTGLIKRMALRLQSESVIERMPHTLRALGEFSEIELSLLKNCLWPDFSSHHASHPIEHILELPPPLLLSQPLDLPPLHARLERLKKEKQQRLKKIVLAAFLVYAFFVLMGATNLMIKKGRLGYLTNQLVNEKILLSKANQSINQWHEFRPAIDPTTYLLDELAIIASQIHGEKIRLITLTGTPGHLQIIGEASDVSQAYRFIEMIKKAPELQEYQWSSGQPKLAGKNSVRFELEGSRPDAK